MRWHLTLLGFLLACGAPAANPATDALVRDRPYRTRAPADASTGAPTPLVILLHGQLVDGATEEGYFQFGQLVDQAGFLYAIPDGTKDALGLPFWNATDDCCDTFGTGVDDVAYLTAVIDDMSRRYRVDPKRVYLVGHSNGGYMAHRMACDRADRVAAIFSLAGDNWKDLSRCQPSAPVAVAQAHGDQDQQVPYKGTATAPSAKESIAGWARLDGCGGGTEPGPALDIVQGMTVTPERWRGCAGGAAELWTIAGGGHIPSLKQPEWPRAIWSWLSAHPKP